MDGWSSAVPSTEAAILKKFGKPQRITRVHVHSPRYETELHEIATIVYARLTVKLYKMPERQIPVQVIVKDEALVLPYGLTVGTRADVAIRILGQPYSYENGILRFSQEMGYPVYVSFKVASGLIRSVEWNATLD